jgi:HPt (histidine-containing phosphotransfer) domain-containing protein
MATINQATFEKLKNDVGADFIGELIAAYCDETPQLLAQLRLALKENDAAALRRAAHSIKSTSNTLGALSLGDLAKELEMMGRAGDLISAQPKVDRLADEYDRVQLALKDLEHD